MKPVLHERDVRVDSLPGRYLRWVVGGEYGLPAEFCSCCVMRVERGQTVRPAHCHPNGEELLYIIQGEGEVFIDGTIYSIEGGCLVLLEKGKTHMVRNTGKEELKVVCFFSPPSDVEHYEYHPEVAFESGHIDSR